jgi:hypothetical protein
VDILVVTPENAPTGEIFTFIHGATVGDVRIMLSLPDTLQPHCENGFRLNESEVLFHHERTFWAQDKSQAFQIIAERVFRRDFPTKIVHKAHVGSKLILVFSSIRIITRVDEF